MSDETSSPLAPEASPLAEAEPNSLDVLINERINAVMNAKPLEVTDAQLLDIIAYYRQKRADFIIESQNKPPRAKPGAKPSAKVKAPPTSVAEIIAKSASFL